MNVIFLLAARIGDTRYARGAVATIDAVAAEWLIKHGIARAQVDQPALAALVDALAEVSATTEATSNAEPVTEPAPRKRAKSN